MGDTPVVLSPEECRALVQRVLAMVNGSRIYVGINGFTGAGTRFARGESHMATETRQLSVDLGLEVDGKLQARGSTNQLDDKGLRALVQEVEALIHEQRTPAVWSDDDFLPFLPQQEYAKGPAIFFDKTIDALNGDAQADVRVRATAAAEKAGLVAAGNLWISTSVRAAMNTRGLWVYERMTYGDFSMTARTKDGTGSGWGWSGYEDWSRVNVDDVIARSIDLGQRSANPVAVEPGRYTVVLEPSAVASLIEPMGSVPTDFWSAGSADAGGTVFSAKPRGTNKIGMQMMDRRLSIVSDPNDPEHPSSMIGSDTGSTWRPLKPVTWFEDGILRNLAYGASYAKEKGHEAVYDPGGMRLSVEGPTQTLEEMIASTKRGIWVNRFSNMAMTNNQALVLTGTTRDGTFLIENGKITKAIKNLRFIEGPFFVLNQLEAWGEPVRASAGTVAPRLKLRDFNFTSLTDAV